MKIKEFLDSVTSLDVETTGVDSDARIVEIGINGDSILVNPMMHIPAGASAVHGIANIVAQKHPSLQDMASIVGQLIPSGIILGHGIDYDIDIVKNDFKRAGVDIPSTFGDKKICTLLLLKKLFRNENIFDNFKLGDIWFTLGLDEDHDDIENIRFHRAGFDSKATMDVLVWIIDYLVSEGKIDTQSDIYEQINTIMVTPVKMDIMPMGKHKGTLIEDVPLDYLKWCINNIDSLEPTNANYDEDFAISIISVVEAGMQ